MTIMKIRGGDLDLVEYEFNAFCPGGGGGLGFAIQIYCEATVICTDRDLIIDSPRQLLIQHLVAAFKSVTGYTGGFRITTSDHGREHIGLGSTCTTATAVVTAMNHATGCPLTPEDIRMVIGHNYVEETEENGKVAFGFETGVGSAASIYGPKYTTKATTQALKNSPSS